MNSPAFSKGVQGFSCRFLQLFSCLGPSFKELCPQNSSHLGITKCLSPSPRLTEVTGLCLGAPTPTHVLESAPRQKAEATVDASRLLFPTFLGDYDVELSVVQNLKTLLSCALSGILVCFQKKVKSSLCYSITTRSQRLRR
jgi:hypothetical protein